MNLDIRHWHCGSSQYQDTGRLVGLDIHPWHWGSILSAQHQAKLARSQFRPKTLDIARYSGLLVPSTEHPGSTPRGRILFSPFLLFSATHYNRSTRDLPPRSQPRRSSSVDGGGAAAGRRRRRHRPGGHRPAGAGGSALLHCTAPGSAEQQQQPGARVKPLLLRVSSRQPRTEGPRLEDVELQEVVILLFGYVLAFIFLNCD